MPLVQPVIGSPRCQRAQHDFPLALVSGAERDRCCRQQAMISGVDDPRRIIGTLYEGAKPEEIEDVVMQHCPVERAAEDRACLDDILQNGWQFPDVDRPHQRRIAGHPAFVQ